MGNVRDKSILITSNET